MTERFAEQLEQDLPPEDVRHILGVFAADLERLWGILEVAEDRETLGRTAHALAGAAGVVGASTLETACRAVMADAGPAAMVAHRRSMSAAVDAARRACAGHAVSRVP